MIFLGTGASEMIPNPMCGCRVCREALTLRDRRDVRSRSALLLDEQNLIDCGPDVLSACGKFGVSLERLKNIFLTHSHSDHFDAVTLENMQMCVTEPPRYTIYLSAAAKEGFLRMSANLKTQTYSDFYRLRWPAWCALTAVEPFKKYDAGDGLTFSAVVGRHSGIFEGEQSLNYIFEKDGKTLFYACDTGLFFRETYSYLQNFKLDALVIENSFGKKDQSREAKHMNLAFLQETIDKLTAQGTVTEDTKIYITHMGHRGDLLHAECDELLQQKYGSRIMTAYDGLRLN